MGLIKVEGQLIHDAAVFVAHGGVSDNFQYP